MSFVRSRWAAVGAAVAITLGSGAIGLVSATNPSDAATFVPITPCRVLDTRPEFLVGPKATPLGPGEVHTVSAHGANGRCTGIPTTATGISINITADNATKPTFLTVWATGVTQPDSASLNPAPGQPPTPNAVITALSSSGQFDIFNLQGTVDVIGDINGYYTDHNHDDRYYTKVHVDAAVHSDVYNMYSMIYRNPGPNVTMWPVGSCLGNKGTAPASGQIPIVIPVGARLISVDVATFDGPAVLVGAYTVFLIKDVLTATSQSSSAIAAAVLGGGQTSVIRHDLIIPDAPETVAAGESFRLEIGSFSNSDDSFCQATVNYTIAG